MLGAIAFLAILCFSGVASADAVLQFTAPNLRALDDPDVNGLRFSLFHGDARSCVPPTVLATVSTIRPSSFTVTVKEQESVFPAASVAVQLTVVGPTGKVLPDAGEQDTVTPGKLSVAVGAG